MQNIAYFNFDESFNHLVTLSIDSPVSYSFAGQPSVKDAIEAMGIPHTEVDVIRVGNKFTKFRHLLQNQDRVNVYGHHSEYSNVYSITGKAPLENGFLVDVHASTLARMLRLLGFNVLYDNKLAEADIINVALSESRIILTKSANLLKHSKVKWGCLLRSSSVEEQVKAVVKRYELANTIRPFTRCIVCNGSLYPVAKDSILEMLPQKTKQYFNEFWQCDDCKRIYWKGSHYKHMLTLIDSICNSI